MAKTSKGKNDNIFKRFFQGRIVSSDFFVRHWVTIVLLLAFSFIYISTKYTCQLRKEKIILLKKELNNAKTDCVKYSADFKSQIREGKMKALVDSMNLNLVQAERPPYKLSGK